MKKKKVKTKNSKKNDAASKKDEGGDDQLLFFFLALCCVFMIFLSRELNKLPQGDMNAKLLTANLCHTNIGEKRRPLK